MSSTPSNDPSLPPGHPTTDHTLSDAERPEEAKNIAESFPSIAQVLEEDVQSPFATQDRIDRIDRIIAAADCSPPTSMAVTSLPPRSETSVIGAGAIKAAQASSSSTSSKHHPTPTVPLSIPANPSLSPPTNPSIPSILSPPSPTPTPTTTAPRLRSLLASLSTSLRRRRRPSTPSPNHHPLATLTLAERIALTTHRRRIFAELGGEWLAPIVHEWPKFKRYPLTCSEERLVDLGFAAPTAEKVEAKARGQGGKGEKEGKGGEGKGKGKAGEEDTRPEFALLTVEAIQILDELARFEFVFRDRAGEWEESVDPKTRTGTGTGEESRGEGKGKGKRRWLGGSWAGRDRRGV